MDSGRSSSTLSKEEIIAIIAGVGGFILIVILVLFLCLIRRRQKPKRGKFSGKIRKLAISHSARAQVHDQAHVNNIAPSFNHHDFFAKCGVSIGLLRWLDTVF